jgi:hypothetical protein
MAQVYRVTVEVGEQAYLKLMSEERRRRQREGRGKKQYPLWRIIEDLLQTLPEPDDVDHLEVEHAEC